MVFLDAFHEYHEASLLLAHWQCCHVQKSYNKTTVLAMAPHQFLWMK